ncbi:uncharacterized protein JCM15063_002375 [Sporobolomyces koalae]|uniref:uncharacterized protein n=1 Tax=Sporobolomyces koalae TaxID=500713 RepID=UPI003170EA86
MSGYDSTSSKRRRIGTVDPDYAYVAHPTTSRTKAAAQAEAARQAASTSTAGVVNQQTTGPIVSFGSLPPAALQRYLTRYGLLETQGVLSYHHAVLPVPPLPATLYPPLEGRTVNHKNAQQTYVPARRIAKPPARKPEQQDAPAEQPDDMLQRSWIEPKTEEFADLTAFDDPHLVVERLAQRATAHWGQRESVKEGETLTNFMFSVRMRDKNLKAIPPASF